MSDKLIIHGLTAQSRIGVTEAERASVQTIGIDLELSIDAAKAAERDDVRDAVDYAELVSAVRRCAESRPVVLLETLAEEIAGLVLHEFQTPQVLVRVTKRALPGIEAASVEIQRGLV